MKHQFGPALAAADAMIRQQQEQSSTAATSGGSGSPAAKAKMAHMNPKRTGVLLDFGTGTSFASFAELWEYLRHNGWATLRGKGLASWYYFPPGCDPKMPHPVLRRDYFDSEDAVIDHVRRTGLERPAPVGTAVSFWAGGLGTFGAVLLDVVVSCCFLSSSYDAMGASSFVRWFVSVSWFG